MDKISNKKLNYKFLPFSFEKIDNEILLTNIFRKFIYLSEKDFKLFVNKKINNDSRLKELENKKFIYFDEDEFVADELSKEYRKLNSYLFQATSLHIFVVTEICNLKCIYCQVTSDKNKNKNSMMSLETARKSVDIAFQSPSRDLAFEFQGGEPLLNFEAIKEIVNYSKTKNNQNEKNIEYRLVTNLTLMNQTIFDFIIENNINVCISIDGDKELHDLNRPFKNNNGTFDTIKGWLSELKKNKDIQLNAIPTITNHSMDKLQELLNTYVDFGFKNIFIRFLSPFGSAFEKWDNLGYSPEVFIEFYEKAIEKIIEMNKSNIIITENYASILLSKILSDKPINYLDLRSPCGAGIGQIAYNWNGKIYTCDEGRMLGTEGDDTFKIGHVDNDSYKSCLSSETLNYVLSASIVDGAVSCSDCAFLHTVVFVLFTIIKHLLHYI